MKKITLLAVSIVSLSIAACGSDKKDDTTTTTPSTVTWKNADMQKLVAASCATSKCHDGTTAPNYKTITEANMKADTAAQLSIHATNSTKMPPSASLTTAQITIFDGFYATTSTTTTTWTNSTMQTLVSTTCATSGCHDGTQAPNYKTITEAAMKLDTAARSAVDAGSMPTRPATAYTPAQVTTFDNFYK